MIALGIGFTLMGCVDPSTENGTAEVVSELAHDDNAGAYQGCFSDDAAHTSLPVYTSNEAGMTPSLCSSYCTAEGYSYAGVQYSTQCFCGEFLQGDYRPDEECDTPCGGNPDIACGGSYRNSVYFTWLPPRQVITFYRDVGYQGPSFEATGSSPFVGWDWNDQISSLHVPPGMGVTLYEDIAYGGHQVYIAGSFDDLRIIGMNDRISSYEISHH
ncbi:MAG TPA: WSC domain-containing protein [Kofleriaceae bacterium]|nr:WSC domain-containing protein [Kofleriaceae bacterium]